VSAGERLASEGAKKAICVIQDQGNVALESRCAGVKAGFSGAVENLNVNRTDMPSVQSTITAKLQQDLRAHPARSASRSADLRNSRPLAATFSSLLVLLLIRQVSNWGVRHGGMG
jgi:simple sugar transport system substrate-binding protein